MDKNELLKFRENAALYIAALKALKLKITFVEDSMKNSNPQNNPVKYVTARIKDEKSVEKKLEKKGFTTIDELHDIVGARVILSSKKDIEEFIKVISSSPIIKVIEHKDYMDDKKNSGYRGYHLILEIPLEYNSEVINIKVELQLRTELQDSWSRIEHAVNYKNDDCEDKIALNLKRLSDSNNLCEELMEECRSYIRKNKQSKTKMTKKEEDLYNKNIALYDSALKKLDSELTLAIDDYNTINPNGFVFKTSRIKDCESVYNKLYRMGYEYTEDNINGHIRDAVGYRIVCSNNSEVLKIVDLIQSITSFRITRVQDYISKPKESGYMGYHFNVAIPIKSRDVEREVIAEIQIRTEAMDAFATYEEEIVYNNDTCPASIKSRLKAIGENIAINDVFMERIYQDSMRKKNSKKLTLKNGE